MNVEIKKLTDEEIARKGINQWPIWEKEVSEFDWFYDSPEQCYILEGEVTVKTDDKDYEIKAGDYVEFPQGLKCRWIIKKDIRKHYNFG
jgi:uncharacterized cupin superfamily protein